MLILGTHYFGKLELLSPSISARELLHPEVHFSQQEFIIFNFARRV